METMTKEEYEAIPIVTKDNPYVAGNRYRNPHFMNNTEAYLDVTASSEDPSELIVELHLVKIIDR